MNQLNITNHSKCEQEITNQSKDLLKQEIKVIDTNRKDQNRSKITTCSKYLDDLLEGGISLGKLTEICGNSGCGKSKLCFQLAINVQLLDGECIFIDTEGSFYRNKKTTNKIHLFRVFSHTELIALIHQLDDILIAYPNVKLIVIDSIAYHFRLNTLDHGKRPVLLKWIAQTLDCIAKKHLLAVVMTNHVTRESEDGPWIPSLGPYWAHLLSNRLFFYHHQGGMFGYLYKSQYEKDNKTVQFCITDAGISDPNCNQLIDFKTIEQHDINQRLREAWQDIINPELDNVWDEEHIPDQLLSEIPTQVIAYEYDHDDLNSSISVKSETIDDDIPPPLSSSPPSATTIDYSFLTMSDDEDINFIQDEPSCFENKTLLKRKRSLITCNKKDMFLEDG